MIESKPAWSGENLDNPHAIADKADRVRRMFAEIAPSYDLNNRLHSLWRDQAWRRATVRAAHLKPTDVVLDVACGTGDLSMAFADGGARRVLGVDFTLPMLKIARQKADRHGNTQPRYHAGDAMRLPLADSSVDVVSIAFGIRNVADPRATIDELFRVVSPGGRVVILEFGMPTNRLMRGMYNMYFRHVLPRTATLIARDRSGAYRYLPQSVNTFLDRRAMADMMEAAGLRDVVILPLTFGIAAVYRGVKPARTTSLASSESSPTCP